MSTPPAPIDAPKGDRIAKLLARAGIASRREIERMIDERRIALDGKPLDTPATILTSLAGITVDGKPVAAPEPTRLFLSHKPPGLLVTERDPAGRATIYDRLPSDLPRTVPVGRLDLSTEGLLLLTTDGGLKRTLELPATGVERTYRARAYGTVTQAMLEDLIEGIEIEGVRYGPIDANLERRTGANVWIEMTLTEGKNREVRRVLEYLGLEVSRLIRTRYGPFVLADLPPGEIGEVTGRDLTNFTRTLGEARRAKGADLQSLVKVEPRSRPTAAPAAARTDTGRSIASRATPRTAPNAVPRPDRLPRPSPIAHPGEGRDSFRQAPRSGASSRPTGNASPERTHAPRGAAQPDSGPRRGAPRGPDDARRPASRPFTGEGPSPVRQPAQSGSFGRPRRDGATDDARPPRGPTRSDSSPRRGATERPDRTPPGPRPTGPAKPGKGPAGGRGHPPRPPKGKPPRTPRGGR